MHGSNHIVLLVSAGTQGDSAIAEAMNALPRARRLAALLESLVSPKYHVRWILGAVSAVEIQKKNRPGMRG